MSVNQPLQAAAAGLLQWARRAGYIDRWWWPLGTTAENLPQWRGIHWQRAVLRIS